MPEPIYRNFGRMLQGVSQQPGGGDGDGVFLSGGRAGSGGTQRPIKVLVADDDRDTVLSLRMLLETERYEVLGVFGADAVFDAVRDFEPDAILLDIGMPTMNGYDIARALRRTLGNDLLLIAVTAWSKFSDRMAAHIAGFDHHVSKPYQPEEILGLLRPLADFQARNRGNSKATPGGASDDLSRARALEHPVLVIEDDIDNARSIALLLGCMGHKVEYAINGIAGLHLAQQIRPRVVILDLKLPDIHGAEMARQIRGHPDLKNVRIIAITGSNFQNDHDRARAAGCDEVLTKPVAPELFDQLIRGVKPS